MLSRVIVVGLGVLILLIASSAGSTETERLAETSQLRNMGRAYYEEEKYEEAVKMFQRCLDIVPDFAMDEINLGMVLVQLGRYKEARQHLAKGEKLDPSLAPYATYNRAIIEKREKRFAEAAKEFERMRELDPSCPDTSYNLAVIYESLNEMEKAFVELTRAVELAPDEIGPHYRRMLIAARLRKMDIAAEERKVFLELRALDSRTRTPEELEMSVYTEIVEPERKPPVTTATVVKNPLGVNFKDVTIETGLRSEPGDVALLTRRPLCWADVDGDPRLDLLIVTASAEKPLEVWRNRGNGAFTEGSREMGLSGVKGRLLAAACGDLDHDGDNELLLSDEEGIRILFRRFGPATTPPAWLSTVNAAVELLLVDFDHDGDLDLYSTYQSAAPTMFRNNGKGDMEVVAEESGLSGDGTPATLLTSIDFDNDNDVDFFLTHTDKANQLLSSMRMGRFLDAANRIGVAEPSNPRDVAVADINNDGWSDLVLLEQGGEVVALLGKRLGKFERTVLGKVDNGGGALATLDYDNDGDEDLFVAGRMFQNDGKFTDVTESVGLNVKDPDNLLQAAAEDYDEDGDLDLAVCWNDGRVALLRNDGGNKNNWLRVSLEGLQSNRFGLSTKVEARDGAFFQRKISLGRPLLFGIGRRESLDVLRLWWPTGVAQNILSPKVCETVNVLEKLGPPSSCPFVYTWDGVRFSFLTDVLDGTALGVPLGDGSFWTYRDKEDLLIPGSRLKSKDGRLVIQLTSELRELVYLDKAELGAIDHSPDCAIYPDECVGPPGTGESRIYSIRNVCRPISAKDDHENDLKQVLSEVDGRHADTFALTRFHGIAETHSLTLDFGDTSQMKQPVLVLTGWIEWSDGDTLFALGQGAGPAPFGPVLEIQKANGSWERVGESIGVPAGIGKNVVLELPRQLCGTSTRLRLTTNFEIYWDRIVVGDAASSRPVKTSSVKLMGADLHFRGFSRLVRGERGEPPWYDYFEVTPEAPWQPQQGLLTRYGDVVPLLTRADDRLVIFGPGDELTLTFPVPPELAAGQERDFVLRLDGWIKDGNPSTYMGDRIEPLPYRAMKSYPPVAERGVVDDPSYADYLIRYNTRPLRRDAAALLWSAAAGN